MSELPYVPFYCTDWLGDSKVRRMTLEQRGAYIDFLCHAWDEGSIPFDLGERAHLIGVTRSQLRRLWPGMESCWQRNDNGGLVNPKMERVREQQKRKQRAGRKGGKAKANA